ncbi:MAG: 30S ribosomal protein S20 [Christensenellaceae bacterium]|nr:30S ribosomal protein S20 [Christensenellaceae bacterium]
MPNIKSAIKRVKVTEKKTLQNKIVKTKVKNAVKRFENAVANNSDDLAEQYKLTVSQIDKAVTKGVLHKNTAARKKSRLAKMMVKE